MSGVMEDGQPDRRKPKLSWANVIVAAVSVLSVLGTSAGTVFGGMHFLSAMETKQQLTDAEIKAQGRENTLKFDEIRNVMKRMDEDRRQDMSKLEEKIRSLDYENRQLLIEGISRSKGDRRGDGR